MSGTDGSEGGPFPFPILVDETLPPGTVKIVAAQTHLIRMNEDESVEFVAGPLDGTVVRTAP